MATEAELKAYYDYWLLRVNVAEIDKLAFKDPVAIKFNMGGNYMRYIEYGNYPNIQFGKHSVHNYYGSSFYDLHWGGSKEEFGVEVTRFILDAFDPTSNNEHFNTYAGFYVTMLAAARNDTEALNWVNEEKDRQFAALAVAEQEDIKAEVKRRAHKKAYAEDPEYARLYDARLLMEAENARITAENAEKARLAEIKRQEAEAELLRQKALQEAEAKRLKALSLPNHEYSVGGDKKQASVSNGRGKSYFSAKEGQNLFAGGSDSRNLRTNVQEKQISTLLGGTTKLGV